MEQQALHSVAQIIQISVAPAFLLVAVGTFMSVATMRLGRVVDRARVLEATVRKHDIGEAEKRHLDELLVLDKRMSNINLSIMFVTFAALTICLLVALLFLSDLIGYNASLAVALLFITTMGLMVIGLLFFLNEILVARSSLHVDSNYLKGK